MRNDYGKQHQKNQSKKKGFWDVGATPKLTALVVIAVVLGLFGFGYTKYRDWENANTLKAIVVDFEALEKRLEQETGIDMTLNKSCFTTQEKFSAGTRTCSISVSSGDMLVNKDTLINILTHDTNFTHLNIFSDNSGGTFDYRNRMTNCGISMSVAENTHFNLECYVENRKANSGIVQANFIME